MSPLLIESLFWTTLFLIGFSYIGYPLVIWMLARNKSRQLNSKEQEPVDAGSLPRVSIIIAAYREEAVILERLNNLARLDYPSSKLEILIGCDGNEDLTGELVSAYGNDQIRLIQFEQRRGKASVLNDCVPQASGEILVFSDANTNMDPQCLKQMVRHFQEESTGCVCGQLVLEDSETGKNVDGLYWKYENFLKHCETRLGAVLGVNGALYALKKSLYQPIPADTIIDDFLIGMRVHLAGQRLIHDETAFAVEESATSVQAEFKRRIRIGTGAFQSLKHLKGLLHPRYGTISFAFWSHKLLRWFCPVFMALAFLCNLFLLNQPLYQATLSLQILFYASAFIGMKLDGSSRLLKLCRVPGMFVQMNLALGIGLFRFLFTRQSGIWERTERSQPAAVPVNDQEIPEAEPIVSDAETMPADTIPFIKS
ncbi:glycosyltransferase family 2 protein [Gimesia sp.]|uniref:glycosyltransferase family 2 protein n=1 Tax=Gimesia sp. TaxID=2024833 RepID=UPI000C3AB01F|nr:glycosyltransferase family 2 protein [Gimesia sp.]MAX37853.1 glycosyl transferase family 2 [Gimesia sp.]HAH48155.1 glycosyltransferase family 2 protein [Planctomycetaceae bacterium]HBL46127.1 glycosyltransferase family 2 protein [Planctomycetaceae bacterium]|tara:strand:+ start:9535 stop:10809 length:1275 start_codon:yes stop_codon:yes gene_type:complete